jgi:uncharacterized membrane protein YdjX (TVP38/TMEM64 family)
LILGLILLLVTPLLIFGNTFEDIWSGEESVARLRSYGGWAWAVGIGLIVADLFLPIPATAVMATLGIVYGPFVGGCVSAVGSFLAGAIAYGATRAIGHRAAEMLTGKRDLKRTERFFERAGGYAVALSRPLPLLPEVIACLAGLAGMKLRVFFASLALGSTATGFAFAAIGHAGADHPALAIVIGSAVPFAAWPVVKRLLQEDGSVRKAN